MKRKHWLIAAMLAAILLVSGCAKPAPAPSPAPEQTQAQQPEAVQDTAQPPAPQAEYHSMTPEQAKERMDSGDALVILDVRTPAEYEGGHIAGAKLLPNETIGPDKPELLPDLNQEILVYCRSGNRSRQAAMKLVDLGYTNVYDFGGVINWPYDLVTGKE